MVKGSMIFEKKIWYINGKVVYNIKKPKQKKSQNLLAIVEILVEQRPCHSASFLIHFFLSEREVHACVYLEVVDSSRRFVCPLFRVCVCVCVSVV